MAHLDASKIRDRTDTLNIKSGDVVTHKDFSLLVDVIQVAVVGAAGGDVLICGNVTGSNSFYDIAPGTYICWGPQGMAATLNGYLNRSFFRRK